jgi:hypothetical protein
MPNAASYATIEMIYTSLKMVGGPARSALVLQRVKPGMPSEVPARGSKRQSF